VYLPGCTGIEAAQIIRQSPAFQLLPIVYLPLHRAVRDEQLSL
jgi:CheY-like chemotaxis protein